MTVASIHARHPLPSLPVPADPHPEFWDFRSRWDAAMAFAGWVTGVDWQEALVTWVKARSGR